MKTFDHHDSFVTELAALSRMTLGALTVLAVTCAGAIGFLETLGR